MNKPTTVNEVVESFGNNTNRILAEAESRGIDHQGSWYIAATGIADQMNASR